MECQVSNRALHVLIVDDDIVTRFLLTEFCRTLNHVPTAVPNGKSCLEKICDPAFVCDLIFMDMHLKGETGIDIARNIRALENQGRSTVPIVALTADPDFALSGIPHLFCEILSKPCSLTQIDGYLRLHATNTIR